MATVWIDSKCPGCGEPLEPGEDAIIVARVKATADNSYASPGWKRPGQTAKLRGKFVAESEKWFRQLWHVQCHVGGQ